MVTTLLPTHFQVLGQLKSVAVILGGWLLFAQYYPPKVRSRSSIGIYLKVEMTILSYLKVEMIILSYLKEEVTSR